ncbi:MAG TPA: hypothetical protein VL728_06015 [Cyclobacteriaceae bacterium]|jgi:hypothetical protein|nr:hypothetical protein [Cyclobacteriaceae bacterium]
MDDVDHNDYHDEWIAMDDLHSDGDVYNDTFSQILFDDRFQVHEIAMFTGHLLNTSQLEES